MSCYQQRIWASFNVLLIASSQKELSLPILAKVIVDNVSLPFLPPAISVTTPANQTLNTYALTKTKVSLSRWHATRSPAVHQRIDVWAAVYVLGRRFLLESSLLLYQSELKIQYLVGSGLHSAFERQVSIVCKRFRLSDWVCILDHFRSRVMRGW